MSGQRTIRRLASAAGLMVAGALAPAHAQDGGQLNVICSVQAEWCNMIQTVFAKSTGVRINMSLKGSGEALAQLIAEKANPKTDVWFGGTGDPHLQAAEQDLSLEYKSPALSQLHGWAQQQAAQSKFRTVGIYSGPLGCLQVRVAGTAEPDVRLRVRPLRDDLRQRLARPLERHVDLDAGGLREHGLDHVAPLGLHRADDVHRSALLRVRRGAEQHRSP